MSFLNLWALWIAAGVIPTLLILYFLKLRRRQESVASTLLWKKAIQDLQVNAPFQKLRKNLLLLLQLLVLAAAIIALARPIISSEKTEEERVVVLIDRSASMNTYEPGENRTRLELAKEQAIRRLKTYNKTGSDWFSFLGPEVKTQIMVIAYSDRASVIAPFTTNTTDLEDLIQRIEPTDAQTDVHEALKLAQAYMAPPSMLTPGMEDAAPGPSSVEESRGMVKTPVSADSSARLLLFSDGRLGDTSNLVVDAAHVEWIKIGATGDNAGITAMRARRNYEEPQVLEVFAKVQNFAAEPITTDVSLYVDGNLAAVKAVALAPYQPDENERGPGANGDDAPATAPAPDQPRGASSSSLTFDLPLDRAAVIEARLSRGDALKVDNNAWAVVPSPRKLRVLTVTKGNLFLDTVLKGLPLEATPFVTPEQYEAQRAQHQTDGQSNYDVVVLDRYSPDALPSGNFLYVGATPKLDEIKASEPEKETRPLIWWDETHPVMRHVGLDYVFVQNARALTLPRAAEVLIEGTGGPLLARYAKEGRNYVVLSFAMEDSNWWSKPSFPVFMYNLIRYLGGGVDLEQGPTRPNATLRIPLPAGTTEAKIIKPDQVEAPLRGDAAGVARFAGTNEVGVYRVEPGIPGRDQYAVNLEDDWESRIEPPADTLRIGGVAVKEGKQIRASTPEIWRWFIGAALAVALFEWYIYNRRVMI